MPANNKHDQLETRRWVMQALRGLAHRYPELLTYDQQARLAGYLDHQARAAATGRPCACCAPEVPQGAPSTSEST